MGLPLKPALTQISVTSSEGSGRGRAKALQQTPWRAGGARPHAWMGKANTSHPDVLPVNHKDSPLILRNTCGTPLPPHLMERSPRREAILQPSHSFPSEKPHAGKPHAPKITLVDIHRREGKWHKLYTKAPTALFRIDCASSLPAAAKVHFKTGI